MAIFVSNPTSAAVTTLSNDALDPSVMSPEEGFTEELAAAMQPSAAPIDALAKTPLDLLEDAGKKATDLQILPAEVLLNAVGDANFAFAGQAGTANSAAQNSVPDAVLTDAIDTLEQDTAAQDIANQLQGAELAAANLAAQMSASAANVPVSVAFNSVEVSTELSVNATSGAGQEAAQASQASVAGPSLQEGAQVASAANLAATQNTPSLDSESISSANASTASQASSMAAATATQVQVASSVQSDAAHNLAQVNAASKANTASASEVQVQPARNAATNKVNSEGLKQQAAVQQVTFDNQASTQAGAQIAADPSLTLNPEASSVVAKASSEAGVAAVANEASSKSAALAASTVANLSDNNVSSTESTLAPSSNSSVSTLSLAPTKLATESTAVSSGTKTDVKVTEAQESSFNFDAKLGKPDALQNSKVIETAVSLAGVAKPSAQVPSTNLTSNSNDLGVDGVAAVSSTPEIDSDATSFNNVQSGVKAGRTNEALSTGASSTVASSAPANRLDSAALAAVNPNSAVIAQEAPQAETTQSLEDISSTFVSSLVGGPQRPVTTVMDWISMQSQERPAPLVPHEVRLDAGAVQLEIHKMVKQGGGHVVMELTPPDQSKFTIELKLDERGNALLIVEGVSDSTKTRLEQSAPQLREQFQQMGLELQLDMRQQGQSASSNAANFADAQERGSGDNNLANNGAGDTPKVLTPREAGANRARESGSNQVYLYA